MGCGSLYQFPADRLDGQWRFGTRRGTQWTWEDLTLPGVLAADPGGNAWISSGGGLYRRRNGSNGWDAVSIPCGVSLGSIAIDEAGALYAAQRVGPPPTGKPLIGKNEIWRRDPSGGWGKETTGSVVERVYTGAGTVHYAGRRRTFLNPDGAAFPYSDVSYYGRRVGSTWSEYEAFVGDDQYQMALDACGAPHFALSTFRSDQDPLALWDLTYARWTAVGWRSAFVFTSQDPQVQSLGIGTDRAKIIFLAGDGDTGEATLPLR